MYFVYPRDQDRFCLRLLLLNVPGATSFDDLKKHPDTGAKCASFRDAALARQLMEDDNEWRKCLAEAASEKSPRKLRQLFALILCHCHPSEPERLWEEFAHDLSEDFLYGFDSQDPNSGLLAQKMAFLDIEELLADANFGLAQFPELKKLYDNVKDIKLDQDDQSNQIDQAEERIEELKQQALTDISRLNSNQQAAYHKIKESIIGINRQKLFFIDGPGGTGKSFLYNTLIRYTIGVLKKTVIVVASSGIAALILQEGRTAHSTFKIPFSIHSESTCDIKLGTFLASKIFNAAAIFWDEAPMLHRHVFEAVNRTVCDVMGVVDRPFGGKTVVFGGDFRQTLPVVPRGSQTQIEDSCIKNSPGIWPYVEALKLTENMRVKQNPQNEPFTQYLLRIGDGREPTENSKSHKDYIRIPDEYIFSLPKTMRSNKSPEECLIEEVYPNIRDDELAPEILQHRAILTSLNKNVDRVNEMATEMLFGGPPKCYKGINTPRNDRATGISQENLDALSTSGLPPTFLFLKVGQPLILLRNMNSKQGLCNGTRLIVRKLGKRYINAEILTGQRAGETVFIPRIVHDTTEDSNVSIMFRRIQFPVKPAFVMTINKSQGQTLQMVGLYLPKPVFTHGQLYVAMSRCTDPRNLRVLIEDGFIKGREGTYTRNIVYKNVLN
jgi:hypothetical protein